MLYLYLKALHIVFVVSWFAGLFYMIRLYIYEVEALNKSDQEKKILVRQFRIMQSRLWHIITWPSAILTIFFGVWMLIEVPWLLSVWMQVKLGFVAVIFGYHLYSYRMFRQFQKGIYHWNSTKLRIWNEVATVLLFAVVFLAVLKTTFGWVWGVTGIVGLGVLLMMGIKFYKGVRNKNKE